jgi:hypothetical protein
MGWLFYHREKNAESNAEHFAKKFDKRYQMVAHGTVGTVFYAALRDLHTDEVSAFIALTAWRREHHNFGYKDMTESMLPGACAAPKKVLDALTETTDEYALEWRANCRRYHEQRAFLRTHLKPGTRLRLTHPLRFTNATTRDTFTYTPSCGRGRSPLVHDGAGYRVPDWRDQVAAVIDADGIETLSPIGRHRKAGDTQHTTTA